MRWPGAAVARHEFRVIATMPGLAIFGIVLPIVLVSMIKSLLTGTVGSGGAGGAGGVQIAVPGIAVAFAAFGAGRLGFAFFRDQAWGTWDRLRASPASTLEIVVGKLLPWAALSLVQMLGLILVAAALFGFRVRGSWPALVILLLGTATCLTAFGALLTAFSRTSQQLNVVNGVCGVALAALGGALVPTSALPHWVAVVAPATPTYWALQGLHRVVLQRGGLADAAVPILALLAFTAGFAVLAAYRFRFEESKVYWG